MYKLTATGIVKMSLMIDYNNKYLIFHFEVQSHFYHLYFSLGKTYRILIHSMVSFTKITSQQFLWRKILFKLTYLMLRLFWSEEVYSRES